ncbi:hypothetical protein CLF_113299 [Clonorchis sinensis]|uniref:Uncharacterized protein n=1 Tax=Clonorchis sinensis TaxID=79923 RepID=G7YY45_CLOSI|nr:hypothetical protein CLF_113299 [Clonorchis sinensis]
MCRERRVAKVIIGHHTIRMAVQNPVSMAHSITPERHIALAQKPSITLQFGSRTKTNRLIDCWSVRRAWQLDCKRFITNRGDIISAGLSDVTSIGDETFAIQLPSSANRPTINQRTRATYIPQHCRLKLITSNHDYLVVIYVAKPKG